MHFVYFFETKWSLRNKERIIMGYLQNLVLPICIIFIILLFYQFKKKQGLIFNVYIGIINVIQRKYPNVQHDKFFKEYILPFKEIQGFILTTILILATLFLLNLTSKSGKYIKTLRPTTDHFLKLLKYEQFDSLYSHFAVTCRLDSTAFVDTFANLKNRFGEIKKFRYSRYSSSSSTSGELYGYHLYYTIDNKNGSQRQYTFSFDFDHVINKPTNQIISFGISGNMGKGSFDIVINPKDN